MYKSDFIMGFQSIQSEITLNGTKWLMQKKKDSQNNDIICKIVVCLVIIAKAKCVYVFCNFD